jgi:hypothetical protein
LPSPPRGFGYLSTSVHNSAELEKLWTAVIAGAFVKAGFEPVIVLVDEYLEYGKGGMSPSFSARPISLTDAGFVIGKSGKPHAVVLTGFSQSKIFTDQTLAAIPSQCAAFPGSLGEGHATVPENNETFQTKFSDFLYGGLKHLLETNQGLESAVQSLAAITNENDARLLLGTALLLQDAQAWQSLWYESKKGGGVPLYIVAPQSFHDSMNRLNVSWGHGPMDYRYRAANSLRAQDYPMFDIRDGRLLFEKDFIEESLNSPPGSFINRGLDAENFQNRVGPLLDSLTK